MNFKKAKAASCALDNTLYTYGISTVGSDYEYTLERLKEADGPAHALKPW